MKRYCIAMLLLIVGGCNASGERQAGTYTLYRNSDLQTSMRVHWGTFDASQSDPRYNANNCEMAARLLNANLAEFARVDGRQPEPGLGFWCEPGTFSESGSVPTNFSAAFPTDV